MKKALTLVLALCLVCCFAFAYATNSKTGEDIPVVVTGDGDGETEETLISIVEDNELTKEILADGDVKKFLPDEVLAQIEGLDVFNEILTIAVSDMDAAKGKDIDMSFTFDTPYTPDTKIAFVINAGDEWAVVEAKANEENEVESTFGADLVQKIYDAGSATLIVASDK